MSEVRDQKSRPHILSGGWYWAALISAVCVLLFALSFSVEAQQPGKIPRVGFLFSGSKDQPHLESFLRALRELGYVEGKNIHIEYRYSEARNDALAGLAADLVAQHVEVILTTTTASNRAALQATRTIPIVSIGAGDPVIQGMAKSLAYPGGNVTGLTATAAPGIMGKRLQLLKEAFPKATTVSYLWNPDARDMGPTALEDAQKGANALGLRRRPYEMKDSSLRYRPRDARAKSTTSECGAGLGRSDHGAQLQAYRRHRDKAASAVDV